MYVVKIGYLPGNSQLSQLELVYFSSNFTIFDYFCF